MKLLWKLIKIQLAGFLGASSNGTSRKKKPWPLWTRMLVPAAACIYLSVVYSTLYFDGIGGKMGDYSMYMIAFFAVMMTILGGLSMALGALYEFKDYDFLMSLPLTKTVIVASKLIAFYLMELLYSFFIIMPALFIFGIRYMMDPVYYILGVIGTFFFPMLPMVIACLIALLIRIVTAGKKHQKLFTNLITFAGLGVYMFVVFRMNMDAAASGMRSDFIDGVVKYIPTAGLFLSSILEPSVVKGLLAIAINLAALGLFVWWLSPRIISTNAKMRSAAYHDKNFRLKETKSNSTLMSLFKRELVKTFGNLFYLINMAMGQVMLVIVAVAMMIYRSDIEILISQIGAGYGVQVIALILMMVIIAAAFMAPVSSVSISLEGKYFWLLKSLPIHTEDVFFSKILVNFVIIAVPSGISWILSAIVFKMTAVTVLEGIAVVLLTAYLVSALGILINLLFPKLVWDREAVVIKQSMSSFVSVLLGLGLSAGMFVLYFAKLYTVEPGILTLALIGLLAVSVLAVTALLMTWGKKRFGRLSN